MLFRGYPAACPPWPAAGGAPAGLARCVRAGLPPSPMQAMRLLVCGVRPCSAWSGAAPGPGDRPVPGVGKAPDDDRVPSDFSSANVWGVGIGTILTPPPAGCMRERADGMGVRPAPGPGDRPVPGVGKAPDDDRVPSDFSSANVWGVGIGTILTPPPAGCMRERADGMGVRPAPGPGDRPVPGVGKAPDDDRVPSDFSSANVWGVGIGTILTPPPAGCMRERADGKGGLPAARPGRTPGAGAGQAPRRLRPFRKLDVMYDPSCLAKQVRLPPMLPYARTP